MELTASFLPLPQFFNGWLGFRLIAFSMEKASVTGPRAIDLPRFMGGSLRIRLHGGIKARETQQHQAVDSSCAMHLSSVVIQSCCL